MVYTWVNGSDPSFKKVFGETDLGMETNKEDIKPQRFQGKVERISIILIKKIKLSLTKI